MMHRPQLKNTSEEKIMTFKQKFENYWYYYKYHTLLGAFFAVVLVLVIVQFATRVEPDYQVILCVGESNAATIDVDQLGREMARYGRDLNGDGRVVVSVSNASFKEDAADGYTTTMRAKVVTELLNANVFIYICDEERFAWLNQDGLFDPDLEAPPGSLQELGWCWKGSGLKAAFPEIDDELYFCIRRVKDTAIAKNKHAQERLEQSRELLDNIIAGEMFRGDLSP